MVEQEKWVQRRGHWMSDRAVSKGVWKLQDGGFVVRFSRIENGVRVHRVRAMPEASLEEAVDARETLRVASDADVLTSRPKVSARTFEDLCPSDRGLISEQIIAGRLLAAGVFLTKPYQAGRYDLLIDDDGKFYRVQVKTGIVREDFIEFRVSSVNYDKKTRSSYVGQVEAFAVYCPETDEVFLVPMAEIKSTSMARLRITAPANKQVSGVLYASDYRVLPLTRRATVQTAMSGFRGDEPQTSIR